MNPELTLLSHSVFVNLVLIHLMICCMTKNINCLDSPFNFFVVEEEPDFLRKVINLHPMFCGSPSCFQAWYGLDTLNPRCRSCSCQPNCRDFNTCCPSLILGEGFSKYPKRKVSCIRTGIRPSNESRMFFLVDKCPVSASPELKFNCEENNSLEISFQTPVMGFKENAYYHYKNHHCSRCHFIPDANIVPYSALLKCKDVYDIYSNSTSNIEVYNAAVDDEGCSIEFTAEKPDVCYASDTENVSLIHECNITGQWIEYDAQVERGCLLDIYRIPVDEMYYNFFCYLCNTHLGWVEVNFELYNPTTDSNDVVDPVQQVTLHNPFSNDSISTQGCYFLDETNECRDIFCSPLRKWSQTEKKCVSKFPTNAFGYECCILLKTDIEDPRYAASSLYDKAFAIKEYLAGRDLNLAVVDLLDLEILSCGNVTYFQQRLSVKIFTQRNMDFAWMDDTLVKSVHGHIIEPTEYCQRPGTRKRGERGCQIQVIDGTNTTFPRISTGYEFSKRVTYIHFTKLTFCCQIRLRNDEFRLDEHNNLVIKNSQVVVPEGSYSFNTPWTEATVCVADFVKHPNITPCVEPRILTEREVLRPYPDTQRFNNSLAVFQDMVDTSSVNRPIKFIIFLILTVCLFSFE